MSKVKQPIFNDDGTILFTFNYEETCALEDENYNKGTQLPVYDNNGDLVKDISWYDIQFSLSTVVRNANYYFY